MKSTYDSESNAAYFYVLPPEVKRHAKIQRKISYAEEGTGNSEDFVLDFDPDGKLVGFEVCNAARFLRPETIAAAEDITDRRPMHERPALGEDDE
jgi:uncharacterized protein YuzE